jgi:Family of unknown function (DUF5670)
LRDLTLTVFGQLTEYGQVKNTDWGNGRHPEQSFVWTHSCIAYSPKEYKNMLWTIFVILLVLWALGMVTAYTMGGLIHLLLLLAVVVLVIRLFQGRRIA